MQLMKQDRGSVEKDGSCMMNGVKTWVKVSEVQKMQKVDEKLEKWKQVVQQIRHLKDCRMNVDLAGGDAGKYK